MALRQLLLTREMDTLNAEQAALMSAMSEIEARRSTWRERESRAEAALAEMNAETTAEEREAFDAECAEIQAEDTAIAADEEANQARQGEIAGRLAEIRTELEELEKRAKPSKNNPARTIKTTTTTEREGHTNMNVRERIHAAIESDNVRTFMGGVREIMQNRGVNGGNHLVPTEFMPILREIITSHSALMKYVRVVPLRGDGKQALLGAAPEAVWTEMVGKINEVTLSASKIIVDGNKVAAYVPVPNSYIEDSDEDLAAIVLDYVGQSIGYAIDKAILYGTGKGMPVGIMTRLGAATKPAWWQDNGPAFSNLSGTHIGKISAASVTGAALFKEMAKVLGRAKEKYGADGKKFWAMNSTTWMTLQTELLSINAAGAVVTGAQMQMPIIGGDVVIMDNIIEDGVIAGGYGSQYTLAERAGTAIGSSAHALFLEDNTVFCGKGRYDGMPVAGEGFAAFSLTTTAPQTTKTFAEDKANAAEPEE